MISPNIDFWLKTHCSNNRKRARASSFQIRIYFKGNIGLVGWTDYK